jgi:hypothetical protein
MIKHTAFLLSTACFPPVQYFTKLLLYKTVYLEQHENFIKQTYRNRYQVLGANGPVSLVVPVVKGRGRKVGIKDLQISYDTGWQRNHWRTIFSAYNSSPFFEYYKDDIQPFFEKKSKFLFEYNLAILEVICNLLEIETTILMTVDFEKVPENTLNFREAISPKKHKSATDAQFFPHPYTQVFSEKSGFIPNLSILDLLFNEGPNSMNVLAKSVR